MWKKHSVVMLPTNKKALIYKFNQTNKLILSHHPNQKDDAIPQHLYLLSDDEIKEGDWFIYNKKLYNRVKRSGLDCTVKIIMFKDFDHAEQFGYSDVWVEVHKSDCKKIIATTDTSIILNVHGTGSVVTPEFLPQPSQSFIEKYVSEYNKGNVITDVLVEYEEYDHDEEWSEVSGAYPTWKERFKVSKDNTITIKNLKDSWTRDEVVQELIRCCAEVSCEDGTLLGKTPEELYEWIEQNL